MLIDIIYNIALLLAVSLFFATHPFKQLHKEWWFRTLMGLAIGTLGLLVMSRPAVLMEGIVFDGRTILLGVSGMFFGPVETIIASVLMICYRILMGEEVSTQEWPPSCSRRPSARSGITCGTIDSCKLLADCSRALSGGSHHPFFMLASMLLMPAVQRAQIFRY
jgi:hypothetical protein